MIQKKDAILREIAGEYILVPIGLDPKEHSGLYVLSDVAKRIWELLQELDDPEKIVNVLLDEYDVERGVLTKDLDRFLNDLRAMGIME